jgi:hypothetical protein
MIDQIAGVTLVDILAKDPAGGTTSTVVYKRARNKKKGSKIFKVAEKATRRIMKAQEKTADRYLERHLKSNRKKKDGWLKDLTVNTIKANRSGAKELKLRKALNY